MISPYPNSNNHVPPNFQVVRQHRPTTENPNEGQHDFFSARPSSLGPLTARQSNPNSRQDKLVSGLCEHMQAWDGRRKRNQKYIFPGATFSDTFSMRELLRRKSFRPRGGICSGGVRQDISCPNRIPNMILTIFKLFMFLSLLPICIINIDFLELDSYRLSQLRMKHAEFCIKYQSSQFLRVFFTGFYMFCV